MSLLAGESQVEVLRDKLDHGVSEDPDKPRMPFPTALVLTRDQEDGLVQHVTDRLDQIEGQLGKESAPSTGNDFEISCKPNSFFGKRQRYTARYYNHVDDRKTGAKPGQKGDTIYNHSNLTASLSQRTVRQMIAKAVGFLFGAPDDDEWFTAEGVGVEDEILADKIKKYARFVVRKNKIKPKHVQGAEFSFVRGETVIKTTNQEVFQIYKRRETFLVDESGEPILDAHGDYITATDVWVPRMVEMAAIAVPEEQAHLAVLAEPVEGQEQMAVLPSGKFLLKRDGVTEKPDNPIWKTDVITRRLVTFEGVESQACYYLDFLAPLNAPGLQPGEADLIAHLYDRTALQIAQMFRGQFEEGDTAIEKFNSAVQILIDLLSNTPQAKSALGQARRDFKEEDTDGSRNNPVSQFAEVWGTYDCDGDGVEEEFFMVLERASKVPIFYEYTANVTLRGLRPFDVQRAIAVDGRWWGMGGMEYLETEQEPIDLFLNRKNFRGSKTGRVTLWRPYNTLEGDRDRNLKLNDGGTYTPKPGMKDEDVLSYITLPDDTTDLKEFIELFMQLMQVKSGVMNGADKQVSALPSSETATEENLLAESFDELFGLFMLNLYLGELDAMRSVIDVIFSNLNRNQVFTYFNGDATEILELTKDDVRDLVINVRLSITRSRDRQVLEAGNAIDGIVDTFYARDPLLQDRTKDIARNRLKSLKVTNPEKVIEPLVMAPPAEVPGQPVTPEPPADL